MNVSIPGDKEGYFGRTCPACSKFFKVRVDEFKAARETELLCAYCGHRAEHGEFMTPDQRKRAISAAKAYAVAKVQDALGNAFKGTSRRSSGLLSISMEFKPGTPPRLHAYVEETVRRTIFCSKCSRSFAVYGAATYCPYCGPRDVRDRVEDEIAAQRRALTVFDHLPDDVREEARAAGVIDAAAADAIENVVTFFEQFCRETFEALTASAAPVLKKERSNVFQSLDDADRLFTTHSGRMVRSSVDLATWDRLKTAFAKRHVITHRSGIVDQKFLDQVPTSSLTVGQRLVITQQEAATALDDLVALLKAAF